MSDSNQTKIGSVSWRDLTVENASEVRDFYSRVVGWKSTPHDMGGYEDHSMTTPDGEQIVAGICHARGDNAKLPPQWLIYITVEDIDESAKRCVEHGGDVIDGPRAMGEHRFCVIRDPAGAVAALISQPQIS